VQKRIDTSSSKAEHLPSFVVIFDVNNQPS
jgi:hypothetical protein